MCSQYLVTTVVDCMPARYRESLPVFLRSVSLRSPPGHVPAVMAIIITKKQAALSNKTQTTDIIKDTEYSYEPFIDKMSITLAVSEVHLPSVWTAVKEVIKLPGLFKKTKWSKLYQLNYLISGASTDERVLFQFGTKGDKPPQCRLEFNPKKLGIDGLNDLDNILGEIFPDGWGYVFNNGRVTRLDVAVDLPGVRMDQFLFLAHQGETYQCFETNGHLETLYMGKPKSNQTRIYSKKKEQLAKGKPFGKSVVRVERTLRNLNLLVGELQKLKNPFGQMAMVEPSPLPPPWEKPKVWSMFQDSVNMRGLMPAMALLPEHRRSEYRKHLKQNQKVWWQPQAIWEKWPEVSKSLK
jgi:hypothetical protein